MKKINNFFTGALVLMTSLSFAQVQKAQTMQVGNTSTSTQSASAALQVDDTTRGFLMPRMTSTERAAITSPATGLQVYDTTTNSTWYYNGTAWANNAPSTGAWSLTGNAATNPLTNFIGTTDDKDFKVKINNTNALTLKPWNANRGLLLNNIDNLGNNDAIMGADFSRRITPINGQSYYRNLANTVEIDPTTFNATVDVRAFIGGVVGLAGNYSINGGVGINYGVSYDKTGITGTLGNLYASIFQCSASNNAATYSSMTGVRTQVSSANLTGPGVRDAYGFRVMAVQANGTGDSVPHNAYGLHIPNTIVASGGTVNNVYSIYSASTAPSYFEGNIGIGTATPTSKLQVVGLPTYVDNAAAITAGLTAGAFYHTGDGIVRVVF